MKIFVTGATGLLGHSLCPYLSACGHTVFSQSRAEGADIRLDLTDYTELIRILDAMQPEIVIHLAAMTSVDACEASPAAAYQANTRPVEHLTRGITRTCQKKGRISTHLIQISTDQVYDGPGPHTEDQVTLTNYYAFSKYAAELAASQAGATVLRTNFFGLSQSPRRQTLSDWLVSAFRNQTPIGIFEDVWFSPLELSFLCTCIEQVVRKPTPGVFNLGSRGGLSKADFAEQLAAACGLSTASVRRQSVHEAQLGAYRPQDMRMDVRLFETKFDLTLPELTHAITTVGKIYRQTNP